MSDYLSGRGFTAEMAVQTVARTGARPLVGRVAEIGEGAVAGTGTTVRVHILRRAAGGYVVARDRLTIWQDAHNRYEAVLCASPEAVLAELGGDEMPRAEASAWREATGNDPAIAAINRVEI